MNDFDTSKLRVGDVTIFRRTIRLEEPIAGDYAVTDLIPIPELDLDPATFLSSVSHISVDPEDPDILHLVGVVSTIPQSIIEYRKTLAQEAQINAMEAILEEDDDL